MLLDRPLPKRLANLDDANKPPHHHHHDRHHHENHHHDQQEGWGSQSSGWSWRRIWFRGLEQGWLLVILQNHHLILQKITKIPFFLALQTLNLRLILTAEVETDQAEKVGVVPHEP